MKNQINRKESSEDAVSPVIGVILMVAITVILAAVIGTFVLELGEGVGDTPQAGFDISDDGNEVSVNLISAQRLDSWAVSITGMNAGNVDDYYVTLNGVDHNTTDNVNNETNNIEIDSANVGDNLVYNYSASPGGTGDGTLTVIGVYQNEDAVLQSHDVGE